MKRLKMVCLLCPLAFFIMAIAYTWRASAIGEAWQPYAGNPVLMPSPGQWDSHAAAHSSVILDDGLYRMYYDGGGTFPAIGLATSPDGINVGKRILRLSHRVSLQQ